jgi:hypothetical protein
MYTGLNAKYPLFLSDFNETEFSLQIFKNTQISNFMKIRPVGAYMFRTDRHDKANSRFSQLCERA